jgi:hypothetical protein
MANGTPYDTGSTLQNALNARDWHNVQSGRVYAPAASISDLGPDGVASTGDETDDAPTTVGSITPLTGGAAGGTVVTIPGTHLDEVTAVHFGSGNAGTSFSVNGAGTSITVTTPAHAAGAVDIGLIGAILADTDGEGTHKQATFWDTGANFTYT